MPTKKHHTPERIIHLLRQAEVGPAGGGRSSGRVRHGFFSSNGGRSNGCFSTLTRNSDFFGSAYRPLRRSGPSKLDFISPDRSRHSRVTTYSPVGAPSPLTYEQMTNRPSASAWPNGMTRFGSSLSGGWNMTMHSEAGFPSTRIRPRTGYTFFRPSLQAVTANS